MGRSRRKYGKDCNIERKDGLSTTNVNPDTNMLVVAPKSVHKKKEVSKPLTRKLSKKQRKNLQTVLERKEKKAKRAGLLEDLSKVQVKSSELALLSSIAHLGTKNSSLNLSKRPIPKELKDEIQKLNSIRGSKKKQKRKKGEDQESSNEDEDEVDSMSLSSDEDIAEEKTDADSISEDTTEKENVKTENESKIVSVPKDSSESGQETKLAVAPYKMSYVPVDRESEIQQARLRLPILTEEQVIMESITHNPAVVICGETGSGKTTQVPQFLFEAGFAKEGMIGVTEPRRVAAISMAKRVAKEMNLGSDRVSYQIRYEGNVTASTDIKFMTDGVLLREVQNDFMLSKYSAIVVDEAHERSVFTDVLIGLLSRIVPLRNKRGKPLRLIIMSATLRVQDFTENERLFKISPPVIKIDTRQYPVTIHFNKKTPMADDQSRPYIKEAYNKICKINRTLPAGGILVFVTGQQEVHLLCKMLKTTFPYTGLTSANVKENESSADKDETEEKIHNSAEEGHKELPEIDISKYSTIPEEEQKMEVLETDIEEKDAICGISDSDDCEELDIDNEEFGEDIDTTIPMHVLPMYSLLASSRQQEVFKSPPAGCRLCVVATNVAETSLTIPGIKYVVDTGKVKTRLFDKVTGISSFQITWISKASADQRAGRSGRECPGHTYRLYSSAVFQDFKEFSAAEIESRPVSDLVLQMKQINIDRVINFPFPTPPSAESLKAAEDLLLSLGAVRAPDRIQHSSKAVLGSHITDLGRTMASFPVHPRFGKMLATATAKEHKELLPYVIAIVASLSVREIFLEPHDVKESDSMHLSARLKHLKSLWAGGSNLNLRAFGDLMVLLGAVGSAEFSGLTPQFCIRNCLRYKAMLEIRKLRSQLTNVVNVLDPESELFLDSKMIPPTDLQIKLLRQIVLSAVGDHVARKIPDNQVKSSGDASEVKQYIGGYITLLMDEPAFIHPSSIIVCESELPEYVVFQEIIQSNKLYMRGVFAIKKEWLPVLCPQYCTFSKPMDDPKPALDETLSHVQCHAVASYSHLRWPLGVAVIEYPHGIDRYKWFARFLLEKLILPALPTRFSGLLSLPEIMTKSWANLQPRTESLLNALLRKRVDAKEKLVTVWKEENTYLLTEFKEWLPESLRADVANYWPPKL